jgi:GlpG protein
MIGLRDEYLYISLFDDPLNPLPEVRSGQVWRLFTPIFLHASVWHLVFNMYWLYQFGTLIERVIGSWRLLALVLFTALASDLLQFTMRGPNFVGMSGVIYGLFGYAWIRGQLDPSCGLWLRPDIVFILLAVFVLCAIGWIGGVANWAHGGGLAAGAAAGYLTFTIQQMRRRR